MPDAAPKGKIACPHCQGLLKSPALPQGSLVNCPKCGQGFRLGDEAGTRNAESKMQNSEADAVNANDRPRARNPQSEIPNPQSPLPNAQSRSSKPNRPDTVDPNLLPPPPPREKPKATQVAVVCQLCGTRMYAPLEKIGQEVKCPDCHRRTIVPKLKEAAGPDKQAGPTLEGTEDYGMSEVVERPKYRPLVTARGEYELLSALDPAKLEHRLTVPGEQPRRKRQPQVAAADQVADEEGGDEDVTLAPEVERVQLGRDPRTILPQPELEAENELYDGRYDDGVIGDLVDPREPDAWKRAPLVYGIVEFLFYPSTLPKWLLIAAMLAAVVTLGQWVVMGVLSDSGFAQARGAMTVFVFVPAAALWIVYTSAAFFAIVERTANGEREVSEWPGLNFLEWIPTAVYWIAATIVACLPGAAVSLLTLFTTSDWGLAAFAIGAPPVLSWLVLFPPVLFSMLAEGSFLSIYSPHTGASFSSAASAWVFFYMYAIMICLLAALAGSSFLLGNIVGALCGSLGLTVLAFLHARLIGRVMWVAAQKDAIAK